MIIGVPKEIKNHEYRVGLTPESARELAVHGHRVLVQTGAGDGIGLPEPLHLTSGSSLAAEANGLGGGVGRESAAPPSSVPSPK